MAHFYGTLQGNRGMATRLGSEKSGIRVSAQSWEGSVSVKLDDEAGETKVSILIDTEGSSATGECVYWGSIEGLYDLLSSHKEGL